MTTRRRTDPTIAAAAAREDNLTGPSTAGAGTPPAPADGPDAIRADIEATRADLGDSVEALAAKADIKARAKNKIGAVKGRAADSAHAGTRRAKDTARRVGETVQRRPAPFAAVVAGLAAALGAAALVRRRRAAKAAKARARTWRRWAR